MLLTYLSTFYLTVCAVALLLLVFPLTLLLDFVVAAAAAVVVVVVVVVVSIVDVDLIVFEVIGGSSDRGQVCCLSA